MAPQIAKAEGVDELTDRHWQVIRFMRAEYQAKGTGPTVRVLGKTSGVSIKELYQLFPKGPAKTRRQDRRDPQAPRLHLTAAPRTTRLGGRHAMIRHLEKVSIIVSKGSLEGHLPGPDHGQRRAGRRHRGQPVLHLLRPRRDHQKRHGHIKVASVGNPGLHLPTLVGALPGMPAPDHRLHGRKMGKLDIPPIPEFIEMIADTGAGLYGCQASCDLFGLTQDDLIDQVKDIITVGEFYALAAGGEIIFT